MPCSDVHDHIRRLHWMIDSPRAFNYFLIFEYKKLPLLKTSSYIGIWMPLGMSCWSSDPWWIENIRTEIVKFKNRTFNVVLLCFSLMVINKRAKFPSLSYSSSSINSLEAKSHTFLLVGDRTTPQSSVTCAPERFRDFRTLLNHPLIQAPILLHYYLLVPYLNFQSDWMRSWCPC